MKPSSSRSQKILVTGGAGFIGSHVVERLVAAGKEVHVLDDLSTGREDWIPAGVLLTRVDVAEPATVDLVANARPDVIVHCAAQVSVTESMRDPAVDARSNILGTVRMLMGARRAAVLQFVYVTTGGALYGIPVSMPLGEDHPIAPVSPYGLSKWVGEQYMDLLAPSPARRIALRLANVYGPRQDARGEAGVVAIFVDRMLRGEPVRIHGDGRQVRDFVYVEDVADAVVLAIESDASTTVNVGTGRATSIRDLFDRAALLTGYSHAPTFSAPRPGDIQESVLAPGKARSELGWEARTPLSEGLERTIAWARGSRSATPAPPPLKA